MVRAVVVRLGELGVSHATERLRCGTVAFAGRAIRAFDADPAKGVGWLAQVISDGASRLAESDGLAARDRPRVAAFDELMVAMGVVFGD